MLIFALPLIFAAKVSNKQEKQIYRIGFGSMTACILLSRVTWISPDECDLRVWAWAGVPHHALDVEAGGGPGHGDVQPLHVSRVTCQVSRGATCHLVAHHARVAQTVDVGGVGGQLQLLQPGHVSRVTSRVMCHV